ncbi:hypothetical protein Fmac_010605 [Flemingia macrophylla]|uniref:AAA+ ATPase domain-containing protein n=1 Tax=Flemingia macrophylla TaxID=520843 RepID=A0ABD1MK21_9FABA
MEIVSAIVGNVSEYVFDSGSRQMAYMVHYKQNVDELVHSVEHLKHKKERLQHQIDENHKNLRNIEGKVKEWLQEVSEFESKFENFRINEGHTKLGFPHLKNRHRLGRRAKKMTVEVKNLIDESPKSDEVAYMENVTSNDVTLSNVGYMEFGSRNSMMKYILALLQDSTIRMIGLHGPSGVGKTTFVKEIANKSQIKKLFNVVVRVEITANPNLQKIQEEIVYVLGLRLEGDGENIRADCLRRRLRKEKESTLIILDDLWDKLDLNKLGIPLDDDDADDDNDDLRRMSEAEIPSGQYKSTNDSRKLMKKEKFVGDYKGCKILLTSRDKTVLSDKMEVKSPFHIKELNDNDALRLFQKVVGTQNEMSNFKQDIVKKYCEGIPMAIITVAKALRDKNESVWEASLEKLKKQELVGVQKPMEISLKMSYDHLENEELKSIFLLCAQMGHQPLIMDLVKYSFGLGILKGVYSLIDARKRIHTLIRKLEDSNLVLVSSNHFNIHDMVRDAALSIAHKEQNAFTLKNGKLDGWHELEKCTSISICNSDIIDELPNVINFPQLKFCQIENGGPPLKIPEGFFEGMKTLRVLIFSGFHLSNLGNIFKCLSNLRMLCLERCILADDLSTIRELKKLRIVSFCGSQIQKFRMDQLGCLAKLQSLDISNCNIKMEMPNFMSKLTSLEELYIRNSLNNFFVAGKTSQRQISFLSELKHLHRLKVVDLSIPCAAVFPKDLFFENLNDYKIVIGDIKVFSSGDFKMPNKYVPFRSLALQLETDNIHSLKGIKLLFKTVENLLMGEINGVKNVIYELNLDGFPDLKHLSITNNFSIKYILQSKDSAPPLDVFPNLESLFLYKLWNIEMICWGPMTAVSFTKLKSIKINMCAHLKNIISSYMVKFLFNLETIDVSDCDSIEEIVEIPVNSDKVEFLKLHSLTLQSLPPSFTSFYSKVEGNTTPPLFGELINISHLESLNLSSINIHKIWCNQSLSSFCFQNLIKLVVKDCNKLRYLCSLSVASGLSMLKILYVSGCHMMEKIFCTEEYGADKAFVFPKLEEIHLDTMNLLIDIWQTEVSTDSFCSLISVHIEKCKKLGKIFPSHMEGWYASLENLKVVNCESVKVIFEIKDSQQRDVYGGIDTNLQSVFLEQLPKLMQVWSIDPRGILNFKKLQSINVSSCYKLRNVFPASVAKDVQKIEYISVISCGRMVEIVAYEDGSEANNEPLVFYELTNMKLYSLPNMERFLRGRRSVRCPKLNKLAVAHCGKLEIFQRERSESTNQEVADFSTSKKLFSNLEYMEIGFEEASKWLWSDTDNYTMHRLKDLTISGGYKWLSGSDQPEIDVYRFLYRMPNLEKLSLERIKPISANITAQQLGVVLHLKELVLSDSQIKDIGFQRYSVLRRLELLRLDWCNYLSVLAPPSVSLTYLTFLEVKACHGLRNLMASSTAKSLVQLKTMKVINCRKIEEIVTDEGDEEDDKEIEIVFINLITIELTGLKCLKSFCSYENHKLEFPSLEILIVRECPMMETFSKNMESPPKLENILAVEGDGEAKWQWEGDLNATILKVFNEKVSFRYSEYLDLKYYPELIEQLWRPCKLQNNNFGNLKRLEAGNCHSLVHVIPSHLLACFENLEELTVRRCSKTEVIFNITDEIGEQKKALGIIRLKRLILEILPKLEHVWKKDPEGIIDLQVLRVMTVKKCNSLKSLFPALVAKKDKSLRVEELEVRECSELVEIFGKSGGEGLTLSCLRSLTLWKLPKLKYLYAVESDGEEQLLIQIQKVIEIRSLKKVSLGIGDMQVTWDRYSAEQLQFQSVKEFKELLDNSGPLNRIFLQMFPNIQKFAFASCEFEEMFSAERPNADYTSGILLQCIKGVELRNMWDLKSIGLEHSWVQPFCENLQTLHVIGCKSLSKLVASACTVYFSNLTCLKVSGCDSLVSLFTSTTAKSLGRLKRLEVKTCESLKEIVSAENESDEVKEIIFMQLEILYLKQLLQLRRFYSGNCTLRFPCLEKVYLIDCWLMESFSKHNRIDNSTEWFYAKNKTLQQCSSDFNTAVVHRTFQEKILESTHNVSHLHLSGNHPLLQAMCLGSPLSIPNTSFSDLVSLTVKYCEFLWDAVLPFNLLPLFTKLKTLKVERCDNVKTIFDVKCITQDRGPTPIPFLLENLALLKLPKLENVWNEDPDGILSMQLQQVEVNYCKCLTSVFPASMAKELVKLETLDVRSVRN